MKNVILNFLIEKEKNSDKPVIGFARNETAYIDDVDDFKKVTLLESAIEGYERIKVELKKGEDERLDKLPAYRIATLSGNTYIVFTTSIRRALSSNVDTVEIGDRLEVTNYLDLEKV